ncbi:MAG: glycosyltransferase family 1 protein [Desulfobacteraceae bacterium]|nr:MAG: glycosyltransferase family 1 protein [Desulfobacteraceae bacterium]
MDGNHKIKIGFVIWTLKNMGGSEKLIYDIVRKLSGQRFEKYLISLDDGPVKDIYQNLGVHVLTLENQTKLQKILKIRRYLLDNQIHIVNPHHFKTLFFTFLATLGIKVGLVHTEHSRWQMDEHFTRFEKFLNFLFLMRAWAVIAISNQIYRYYVDILHINKDKVYLIKNGIELNSFKRADGKRVRRELKIGAHEKIIGMIAHVRPEKNHGLLINAFNRLVRKHNHVHLVLAGFDFSAGKLSSMIGNSAAAEKIHYIGPCNDVPGLLSTFDLFCLTSIKEGMPLSILEAMASGVAVIGNDTVGINEVLEDHINGLLFEKNNEDSLVLALEKLIENEPLRESIARAGKNYVHQNYCLDEKISAYDDLFKKLESRIRRKSLN